MTERFDEAAGPYKGLVPFDEEDAAFFFGRESEQEVIAANLQAYRLTLLYGASGVGKSSVLRAGVAHRLRRQSDTQLQREGQRDFLVAVCSTWSGEPSVAISEAIATAAGRRVDLEQGRTLVEMLRAWTSELRCELLLIFDQFEDYFRYHPTDDARFALEFPEVFSQADLPVNVLLGLREDALASLDRFKGRIPNLFENYLRVLHLDREMANAAIREPIQRFNDLRGPALPAIRIEPELVEAVLDQVRSGHVVIGSGAAKAAEVSSRPGDDRIEAPYLQLVLSRLWREEIAKGSPQLRLQTLERLGGASQIVRTHLDGAMGKLSLADQYAAARAFRYLVTASGTKIAYSIKDLADYSDVPQERLEAVAEALSSGSVRILRPVLQPGDVSGTPRYEIFHDVLAAAVLDWRERTEGARRAQVLDVLDRLHRRLRNPLLLSLMSAALIALVLVFAVNPSSMPFELSTNWQALFILAVIPVLLPIAIGLFGVWRRVIRAVDLGFSWSSIVDVLIDRRGDCGAIVSGSGIYGSFSSNQRARLIIARRLEAAGLIGSILALVVSTVGFVALASRGGPWPPAWVWWTAVGMPIGVWVGAASYDTRKYVRARRRARAKGEPARRWLAAGLEAVTPGDVSPRAARRARSLGWMVLLLPVVLLVDLLATGPFVLTAVVGTTVFESLARDLIRYQDLERPGPAVDDYQLPSDPTITALDSGRAYWALLYSGSPAARTGQQPPVRIDEPWTTGSESAPFEAGTVLDFQAFEGLLARAQNDLTDAEVNYLRRLAAHPGLQQAGLIARAQSTDLLAAKYADPQRIQSIFSLTDGIVAIRNAACAHIARAAMALRDGHPEEAELTIRELLSFGQRVHEQSHSLFESLIAQTALQQGLRALADLFAVTGRSSELAVLRSGNQSANGRSASADVAIRRGRDDLILTTLDTLEDEHLDRGLRWEALLMSSFIPCTRAGTLVVGPTSDLLRAQAIARNTLVRSPQESQLFENVVTGVGALELPDGQGVRFVHGLTGAVASILRSQRLSSCSDLSWSFRGYI